MGSRQKDPIKDTIQLLGSRCGGNWGSVDQGTEIGEQGECGDGRWADGNRILSRQKIIITSQIILVSHQLTVTNKLLRLIIITDPTEIEGREEVSGKQSVSVKTITMFATFTEKGRGYGIFSSLFNFAWSY